MPSLEAADQSSEEYQGSSRSIIMDIVAQLSQGADLHRGLKKPYNPVLGEYFCCHWNCPDGSKSYYLAEQVSHHPPVSAFVYANDLHKLVLMGNMKPRGKFLGNTIMSLLQGSGKIVFLDKPHSEYHVTFPNIYARGILFGSKYMELGDKVSIVCEEDDLIAELDFKIRGYFSSISNEVKGTIRRLKSREKLYELAGTWSDEITLYEDKKPPTIFWKRKDSDIVLPQSLDKPDISSNSRDDGRCGDIDGGAGGNDDDEMASRRLWRHVTEAILKGDFDEASKEKIKIEELQRRKAQERADLDLAWSPKFFTEEKTETFWHFAFSKHGVRDRGIIDKLAEICVKPTKFALKP